MRYDAINVIEHDKIHIMDMIGYDGMCSIYYDMIR